MSESKTLEQHLEAASKYGPRVPKRPLLARDGHVSLSWYARRRISLGECGVKISEQ